MTTTYVGAHYEVKDSVVTKYYFAGAARLAYRENGTLSYVLSDHLGSSSITTDGNGITTAEMFYKAWGEIRLGSLGIDYQYTGQRNEAGFGLYFYNARWYDPSLGRFAQADSIVPPGVQGLDRYAYVNNSPMNYVDPSGHFTCSNDPENDDYCPNHSSLGGGSGGGGGENGVGDEGSGNYDDPTEGISFLAFEATVFDTLAFLLNAAYLLGGSVVGLAYPPSIPVVEGAYQPYSILPNTLSSVATVFWFLEGIRTEQTTISINLESSDTGDFSTTNIISGTRVSLSLDQDTAVSGATNYAGWTVLRDPLSATIVDFGVAMFDYGRNSNVLPILANPTISYSTSSGWDFSRFPK